METILDNYKQHNVHDKYDSKCSSCFTENLLLHSRKCPADKCKGNGVNNSEATYCEPCQRYAESFDIGN